MRKGWWLLTEGLHLLMHTHMKATATMKSRPRTLSRLSRVKPCQKDLTFSHLASAAIGYHDDCTTMKLRWARFMAARKVTRGTTYARLA